MRSQTPLPGCHPQFCCVLCFMNKSHAKSIQKHIDKIKHILSVEHTWRHHQRVVHDIGCRVMHRGAGILERQLKWHPGIAKHPLVCASAFCDLFMCHVLTTNDHVAHAVTWLSTHVFLGPPPTAAQEQPGTTWTQHVHTQHMFTLLSMSQCFLLQAYFATILHLLMAVDFIDYDVSYVPRRDVGLLKSAIRGEGGSANSTQAHRRAAAWVVLRGSRNCVPFNPICSLHVVVLLVYCRLRCAAATLWITSRSVAQIGDEDQDRQERFVSWIFTAKKLHFDSNFIWTANLRLFSLF